jgi:hypothetical protein
MTAARVWRGSRRKHQEAKEERGCKGRVGTDEI